MAKANLSGLNITPATGNISNISGAEIVQQRKGDLIAADPFAYVEGQVEEFVNATLPLNDIVTVKTGQKMGVQVVFDDVASAELFSMSRSDAAPTLESSYASTEKFVMQFGEKSRYMNHIWENTKISELSESVVSDMIAKTVKKWNEAATKETLAFLCNTHPRQPITAFAGANYKIKLLQIAQSLENTTGVPRENFVCLLSPAAYDKMLEEQLGYDFPDIYHAPAVNSNPWGFQSVKKAPFGYLPADVEMIVYIKRYTFYATGPTMPSAIHVINDKTGRPNTPRFYCEEVYEIDTYDKDAGLIITNTPVIRESEPQIYFTHKEITVPVGTTVDKAYLVANNGLNAIGQLQNFTTEDITDNLTVSTIDTIAPAIFEQTITSPAVVDKYLETSEVIRVRVVA